MDATFSVLAIGQLWQVTALIVIVALVNDRLSRKRPHLAHVLWLVVLAKCLTPPLWSSTGGVFCWLQPEQVVEPPVTQLDTEWQAIEWQELLVADSAAEQWEPADDSSFAAVPLSDAEAAELLEPAPVDVDWPSVLAASWLTSVAVVLFVVAIRWWLFWRRLKRAPRREYPELDQQLTELARQLGVQRVQLLVTESRIGPAVVGLFRRTILLPAIVVDRLAAPVGRIKLCADPAVRGSDAVSTEQLAEQDEGEPCRNGAEPRPACDSLLPILAHELLHVRRGDLWVGLLQTLAQAVWWFHPLVWWVGRLTNREAERCCDEEVLAELKCDPAAYARSLLDVLELKSQLAPVPVFPGVRPVDVTSKRLERIMTLGQGSRRRTPWWCWLIALGTAALTLPGAAFVVSAQEEAQQAETSSDGRSAPVFALQADGSLGPAPPVPAPGFFMVGTLAAGADSPKTTVAYNTSDFAHLLIGSQDEQQQKFERLVRSRDQVGDAEIKWFNGKPIVRMSDAGHQAVQECLAFLAEANAAPQDFEEFLDSVGRKPDATLVVELQVITLNEDAHRGVEAAMAGVALSSGGSVQSTVPIEKWQAIEKAIPPGDDTHFAVPQFAVINGRGIRVESVLVHPDSASENAVSKTPKDANSESSRWTGWKGQLLPFERVDGSFWLGMKVETGIMTEGNPHPGFSQRKVCFKTTLASNQLVVLTGFPMTDGDGRLRRTVVTARVRSLGNPSTPNAIPAPRKLAAAGVESTTVVSGDLAPPRSVMPFQPIPNSLLPADTFRFFSFNLTDLLEIREQGWAAFRSKKVPFFSKPADGVGLTPGTLARLMAERFFLSAEPREDSGSFVVRADHLLLGRQKELDAVNVSGNVSLKLATAGMSARATAARISQTEPTFISFYLTDAKLIETKDGKENVTEAPAISLLLNVLTREVDRIEVNRTGAVAVQLGDVPGSPPGPQTPGAPIGNGVVYVGAATNGSPIGILPLSESERIPFAPQSLVAPVFPVPTGSIPSPAGNSTISDATINVPAAASPFHHRRQIGPVIVEARQRGDGATSPKLDVKVKSKDGRDVLFGTADAIGFRDRAGEVSMKLSMPKLEGAIPDVHRLEARELRLSVQGESVGIPEASILLELDDAVTWLEHAGQGISHLKAEQLSVRLNVETASVERLNGEGLKLLRTNAPVIDEKDRLVAAAYPVADLVVPIPQGLVVHAKQETDGKEWKVVDQKDRVVPAAAETSNTAAFQFDELIELIQSTVKPESWKSSGGLGMVAANESTLSLVIRQTQPVHEEISDLFNQLRRLQDISVQLQTESLKLEPAVLQKLKLETAITEGGEASQMRFVRLTAAQAERLRGESDLAPFPDITLFNGQTCELALPGNAEEQPSLALQTMVSGNRRFVRLGVARATRGKQPTSQLGALPAIPDGEAILVELAAPDGEATTEVGVPIPGRPKAFRMVRPTRQFILIQPRIVIAEEEEELLGIEP